MRPYATILPFLLPPLLPIVHATFGASDITDWLNRFDRTFGRGAREGTYVSGGSSSADSPLAGSSDSDLDDPGWEEDPALETYEDGAVELDEPSSSTTISTSSGSQTRRYTPETDVECGRYVPRQREAWPFSHGPDLYQSRSVAAWMRLADAYSHDPHAPVSVDPTYALLRRQTSEAWWLCSIHGESGNNLAMMCNNAARRPHVLFNVHEVNAALFTPVLRSWCEAWCWCGEEDPARGERMTISGNRVLDRAGGGLVEETRGQRGGGGDSRARTRTLLRPEATGSPSSQTVALVIDQAALEQPDHDYVRCSSSCSHFGDCGGRDCVCTARRRFPEIEHEEGGWLFLGSCTSASGLALGNIGRRGLGGDTLCPCNATYVSEACCSSPSGIVWEPPELKRGVLMT